jgi:hypothetical protein
MGERLRQQDDQIRQLQKYVTQSSSVVSTNTHTQQIQQLTLKLQVSFCPSSLHTIILGVIVPPKRMLKSYFLFH